MSLTGRYRERKYNTSENDRLLRALSQPVQAWDKQWALHSNSKAFQTYKWVRSERPIEFEEDEESEPEVDMGTTQILQQQQEEGTEANDVNMEQLPITDTATTIINKPVNAIIQEEQTEEDEKLTHTPKLDDISDEEKTMNDDDDDDDDDNNSDPSKHPALAPHAEVHMTDDDIMTDSAAATPSNMASNNDIKDEPMEDCIRPAYYQAKISPNAQYVANATANRIVIRRSSMDLSIVNVFECLKPVDYIQWSPNSECILAANYESSRIEVHSIIDPKWTATIKDLAFPFASVQWTVDSKNIITVSQMNYEDKAIETSPDGKYVAVVHKRNGKDTLSVYHSSSFILLEQFELNMVDVENIRWSPDSSCIAVWDNCLYNNLIVYRTDGYICTTYEGYEHGLGIKSVCWSQNGKFLAIGYYDQTIHLLYTLSWKLITILSHPSVLNNTTTNIALYEEVGLSKTQVPTLDTLVAYRQITKRPFNIPSIRSDLNQPNPRTYD
ncbi:hypothetical protein G6F61_003178 [Rhizopus arrhizus]|nr:hypothetical protein G6F61_003178 [Rhizopus arrhizus]